MHDAQREIEAKFNVDPAGRRALLALRELDGFAISDAGRRLQIDLYFDTADRALARTGATLRVRHVGERTLVTFKGARETRSDALAHIATRLEDEVAAPSAWAENVSGTAPLPDGFDVGPIDRARRLAGAATLAPVAQVRTERDALRLTRDGAELELALDHCVGTRLADGRVTAFDEVELEAARGDLADLRRAQTALERAAPGLRPSQATKLARTLE